MGHEAFKGGNKNNLYPYSLCDRGEGGRPGTECGLREYYCWAERRCIESIEWFLAKKESPKRWSRFLRLAALIVGGLGGLVPLTSAARINGYLESFFALPAGIEWNGIGYVLLGVAGLLVLIDKLFGFSSSWMRYMTTQIRLQQLLIDYQAQWCNYQGSPDKDSVEAKARMYQNIRAFLLRLMTDLEEEIGTWANDYRAQLARMEQDLQKRQQMPNEQTV